jgi:hypothetical protein
MSKDLSLDQEGIPDLDDALPGKTATGDPQEGLMPPSDRPDSLGWGTTAEEQRAGEPLSMKIERERPDVVRADPETVELVAADDAERDYGEAVDTNGQGLTAEEAAMHVVDPEAPPT